MTKFAFIEVNVGRIRQYDTATPATLPFLVHAAKDNTQRLAFTADKEFELIWGGGGREIRKTQGPLSEEPVYAHSSTISAVKVRRVNGQDRVYFSALKNPNQSGPQYYDIYYLGSGQVPSLYTTIDPTLLTIPNPCNPAGQDWYWYSGDFVFGDNDTLYLSSGNLGDTTVGIYRMKNASPNSVSGAVQRIHLTEGPVQSLSFRSPHTLYFKRNNAVWKLDLSTSPPTESLEGVIPLSDPNGYVSDLAEVGDGLPKPPWWTWITTWHNLLAVAAQWMWRTGDAVQLRSLGRHASRTPPAPPRAGP